MKRFTDYQSRIILLSEESEEHILFAHPEVTIDQISQVLSDPDEVRKSQSRIEVKLYYQLKTKIKEKDRYICVVVKITSLKEEFIVSAMTTSRVKDGETVFKKERKV